MDKHVVVVNHIKPDGTTFVACMLVDECNINKADLSKLMKEVAYSLVDKAKE